MQHIYGTVINGIHSDTSNSLHGAKCYATRNNLDNVSIRYNCGYTVKVIYKKVGKKWLATD